MCCMQDVWAVIDRIAADLGVDENNRRVWRQRQVPHKWRLPILAEAKRRRIKLDEAAFDQRHAEARS